MTLARHSSKSNEHYTPAEYIEAARLVMGSIELDPASCRAANATVRAKTYFTVDDNGLSKHWTGRVWLNPPYGKTGNKSTAGIWLAKLATEYSAGRVDQAIYLVHANTAQKWFAQCWKHTLCFVNHRIHFIGADGQPNKNQPGAHVFGYLGPHAKDFGGIFKNFGRIVRAPG